MIDKNALKYAAAKLSYNVSDLARILHISHTALYRRLKGQTDFKLIEIVALSNALSLSDEERDRIFFTEDVAKYATSVGIIHGKKK